MKEKAKNEEQKLSNIEKNNIVYVSNDQNYGNEINLILNIDDTDVGKAVSFLDNNVNHNNLSELNEENTKLYINDKKQIFKKYFIPKETGIYKIKLIINIKMINCNFMFAGCYNLINVDLSSFNTENVINMEYMFWNCFNLTCINFSRFNTKNLTNMKGMFSSCYNLSNADLSSFNTENVVSMKYIFWNCFNIINIDLSSLNSKNLRNTEEMFYNCTNLINLKINRKSYSKIVKPTNKISNIKIIEI